MEEKIISIRIDKEKAMIALKTAEDIRKSKVFDTGKSSIQIIREWRDKRK